MQQHLLLVDETFDLNFTQEYHLSIQFSLDGFSFCIRDGLQNKYVYLFHKEFSGTPKFLHRKLADIYAEFDVLTANFKTTQLVYSSPDKMQLIPEAFFSGMEAQANYQLNHKLEEDEELSYLPVKSYQSLVQIAIVEKVKRFFEENHPGTMIQHEFVNVLNRYAGKTGKNTLLDIQIYKNQFILSVLDQRIHFCNSFAYRNDNDLLYFILNVAQRFPEQELAVHVNGRINKRAPIYHHLRQYFKYVSIQSRNHNVAYSYLFDQLPDARFVNLFNTQS